jgi:small subunit ribosomal protein S6
MGLSLAMRDYELVTIINPEEDGGGVLALSDKISEFISDRGGTVEEVNQWGKRKLAYPIEKFLEGSYILTRFKLEPKLIRELEAGLKASEKVLRHLVVKVGD